MTIALLGLKVRVRDHGHTSKVKVKGQNAHNPTLPLPCSEVGRIRRYGGGLGLGCQFAMRLVGPRSFTVF